MLKQSEPVSLCEPPIDRLRRLLDRFERDIDLQRVEHVRSRYRQTLRGEPCDPPPLVCYVPYDDVAGPPYPVRETLDDPVKMLVNELLVGFTSLYHALQRQDDTPFCLRANVGTGLVASMFGAPWEVVDNNPPWVRPLGDERTIEALVSAPLPETCAGLGTRVRDHYACFHDVLGDYPNCRAAFEITLPDLQGPFSTAELLWGSQIYLALHRRPDLVQSLLTHVTAQTLRAAEMVAPLVQDSLAPEGCFQHATAVSGTLLLRNDSAVLVSPSAYETMISEHDARIAGALNGIAIHFCGDGSHQVGNWLALAQVRGLDFGQADLMDQDRLYREAREFGLTLARLRPSRDELITGRAAARFPAGATFCYEARDANDAAEVCRHYYGR